MNNSRTKASILNSISASATQILNLIMSFFVRLCFIKILGEQYLGLNGLFTNVLSILSFTELGIGAAITFSLYKPLAESDVDQISALMQLYGKIYHIIAATILVMGLIVMPFLHSLINGSTELVGNIYVAFLLFLLNSVVSYLWNYKRSIFFADQSGYINSLNTIIFQIVAQVLQITFLLLLPSYYIYLIIQILLTLISNFQISRMADKRYPFLKQKKNVKVLPETIKYLKKNVIGMMSSKLGGIVVFGTDNLLLSIFLGLGAVAKYSNYTMILTGVTGVLNQGISAVSSSIGNLNVTSDKQKQTKIFYKYSYLSGLIGLIVSIGLATYFGPFIDLWVGPKFVLSPLITWLIVVNFFVNQLRQANINFTNAHGLYWEQRYKPIAEALLNLVVSLVLIKFTELGIGSVLIGTITSNLFVNAWWEPFILLKFGLNENIKTYSLFYMSQLIIGIILITLSQFFAHSLNKNGSILEATLITTVFLLVGAFIFESAVLSFGYPKKVEKISFIGVILNKFF